MADAAEGKVGLPRWMVIAAIPFVILLGIFALRSFVVERAAEVVGAGVEGDIQDIKESQAQILRATDKVSNDVEYIRRDVEEMRQFRASIDERLRALERNTNSGGRRERQER